MAKPVAVSAAVAAAVSVLERLRSDELIEFTSESVRAKLEIWKNSLAMIQSLLTDVEKKKLELVDAEIWLESLLELAYDAEDILDEYIAAALKRKLEMREHQETCWKQVSDCRFLSRPRFLLSEFNLNFKFDGITRRLEELYRNIHQYIIQPWRPYLVWRGRPVRPFTGPSPTDSVIYGREEDRAKLLEMLLTDEPEKADVDVISIVGMPGVGKTLLAQELYDCPEVRNSFELQAWVFVSDNFDIMWIYKHLLISFSGSDSDSDVMDLISIQSEVREFVSCHRFLLVLDDVWCLDSSEWEVLLSPLMAGARGSRIIVTTRHQRAAHMVTTSRECCHTLGLLSDDDCWSLFMEHVFDTAAMGDPPLYSRLIRQKVIESCQGLPYAAKIRAEVLRYRSIHQWLEDLEIWEVMDYGKLHAPFQLSYYHLPLLLKRCFAYCAIFPNGYEFEEQELVFAWMAENLIPQAERNKQLEDIGRECFHELVSRSIFQKSTGNNSKYIMHNLFNDVAQKLLGGRSFCVKYPNSLPEQLTPSPRHVSSLSYPYTGKFELFADVTLLRTYLSLLPVNNCFKPCDISGMFVSNLLQKCKKLRALSLQNYDIKELPNSIESLSLLQLLNLSGSEIRRLSDSINLLHNLQTLILRNCRNLSKLPLNLGNLIRLRHFDIFGACLIDRMPLGMQNWKSLKTLSNFVVGKDTCSTLNDLRNLEHLCGEMHVTGLENMVVLESTPDMMILSNKKDLKVLLLDFGSQFDGIRDARLEEMVLHMLQPHQNLEELTIRSYRGTKFSWLENKMFCMSSAITILKLEDCMKCRFLPPLGLLSSLKNLSIKGLIGIKSLGLEFYGEDNSTPFPSLETLSLEGLEEWEVWMDVGEEESVESFSKLRELSIVRCNKLRERLPKHLKLLEKLMVRNCKELIVPFSTFSSLCKLEIDECRTLVCDSPIVSNSLNSFLLSNVSCAGNWLEQGFLGVEILSIKACDELVTLLEKDKKSPLRHGAISVRELCVEKSENVATLLEGIAKYIAGLETLQIVGCNTIFVFIGQLPSSLKRLDIRNCMNLQRFLEDYGDTSSHSCTFSEEGYTGREVNSSILQLEELYIQECPSLICLPQVLQFAPSLTHLHLKKCAKLTSLSSRSALPSALKFLVIEDCSDLTTLLPRGQLPETLERLKIRGCPKLRSLSSRSPLPTVLKLLEVEDCLKLTALSASGELPESLESLKISGCPKLESIVERFHNNTSLREIWMEGCEKLKCIPDGVSTLSSLCEFGISYCPCLVSFPEDGFPDTVLRLWIKACENLQALPSQIHNLPCLQLLSIWDCPNMSFHVECLPKNLESLSIQGHNLYQALQEEDLRQLTSLREFSLCGLPDTLSFQVQKIEKALPSSLTRLYVGCFPNLEDLSSLSLQDLENLEWLSIDNCPKLKSLPSLPRSLVELYVNKCPLLENKGRKGQR